MTPLGAVGFAFFANGALYASWVARLPTVRAVLGVPDDTLGFVLLAPALAAIVAFRFASALVHAYGTARVTRWSALAFCASVPCVGLVTTPVALALVLAAAGASGGLMDVAMNANGIEVERRAGRPILSALHGLFSLGGLVGASLGALAAHLRLALVLHFAVVAALLAAGLVLATSSFVEAEVGPDASRGRAATSPRLLGLGLVAFCSSIGEGAMADWTAIYLRDLLHTSDAVAALGYAVFSLAMLTGRFTGDRVTARLGDVRVVRLAGLLVAAGLAAGLALHALGPMLVGVAAAGLGLSVLVPIVFRAGGRDPDVAPGAALATIASLSYGAFLVGPPVIGVLAGRYTLRGALVVVVVLATIASALAGLVRPRERPR